MVGWENLQGFSFGINIAGKGKGQWGRKGGVGRNGLGTKKARFRTNRKGWVLDTGFEFRLRV